MKKPYNYRNPTAQERARAERIQDAKDLVGMVLFVATLVGWCIVLK